MHSPEPPDDLFARELAADRRAERGDWAGAAGEYEAILDAGGWTMDADTAVRLCLKAARAYENTGALERAAQSYRVALGFDPRNPYLYERLRAHLREMGAWRDLADLLREMVEQRAAVPRGAVDLYLEAARIFEERLGAPHEAMEMLQRAIVVGDAPEAFDQAEALARRHGTVRDLVGFLCTLAERQFGPAEPERCGRTATRAAELLLRDLDDEEGAKEVLGRAAALLLGSPRGEDAAFELLHRLYEIDPTHGPMLRAVADYHRDGGEPGEARRFYQRYCEVAPGAADAAVVELRLAQIALGSEEEEVALKHLSSAAWRALPLEEIPTARILADRLADRMPHSEEVEEVRRILDALEREPERLERELHRAALAFDPAGRVAAALRLGRLREARLGDPEGAAAAYRHALRAEPANLEALGAAERLLDPALVLSLARTALSVATDPATQDVLHALAARAARRAGDGLAEAEHRYEAFRLAPDDPARRRRAATALRKVERWAELVEVLQAETGNRLPALLEGAEILADRLGMPDVAAAWADEALGAAIEAGRQDDIRRATAVLSRLAGVVRPPPPPSADPPREQDTPVGGPTVAVPPPADPPWEIDLGLEEEVAEAPGPAAGAVAPLPDELETERRTARAAVAKGLVLEAQGNRQGAIAAFEQAIEAMPRSREALEHLARLYAAAGRREDAQSCLERLLYVVEDPRERARVLAARAALELDRLAAENDLRQALALAGGDRGILDECAAIATRLELWEMKAVIERESTRG